MDSTANFGSSRVYPGVLWLPPLTHICMYIYGVLNSGHIGVINSGRKKIYLEDRKFVKDSESGLKNRCSLSYISRY